MNRKHGLLSIVCVVVLSLIFFVSACKMEDPATNKTKGQEKTVKLDEVNFQLNWIWNPMHKVLMPGVDKGFFAEEGIKVNFLPGSGSGVAIKSVAMGQAEFGFASASELLIAQSQKEVPVKILGCLNQKGMTAIFFPKNSGIRSAKDFEGKTIAGNFKSLKTQAAAIYLKLNGVDMSKVKFVGVPKGQDLKYLMMGKVDSCVFAYGAGRALLKLQGESDKFDCIYLEDHGVTLMDICFIVNEDVLKNRLGLARRFMRAAMKSWRYAAAYPEEANEMLHRHVPTISVKYLQIAREDAHFLYWSEETLGRPLGWVSPERLAKTQEILIKAGKVKVKGRMDLEKIYTNDYVY